MTAGSTGTPVYGYFTPLAEAPVYWPSQLEVETCTTVIQVLIVEDHLLVAEAMAHALAEETDIQVARMAANLAEARTALSRQRVDIALLDFHLPDGDGLMLAKYIISHYPGTKVIMVTALADREVLIEALQVGCSGFISKEESLVHLPAAIRSASSGTTAISPGMAAKLVAPPQSINRNQPDSLEKRELEILTMMGEGYSSSAIAERLFISPNTLRNHLTRINQKLDTHSKVEALAKALRMGLISMERTDDPEAPAQ